MKQKKFISGPIAVALSWTLKGVDDGRMFKSAGHADIEEGSGWPKRWNGAIKIVVAWVEQQGQ